MSVTYPVDPLKPYGDRSERSPLDGRADIDARLDGATEEPFVPVYARRGKAARGGGKIRTWMILAPIGVIVLGGFGAMMAMNGEETATPLAEPAATAPVVPATPLVAEPAPVAALSPAPVVEAAAPPPVQRAATPVRRAAAPAPAARRAAPTAAPRIEAPAARVATPAPTASSSTTTLNTAPTAPAPAATVTPAPAQPPAPVIVVQPLG